MSVWNMVTKAFWHFINGLVMDFFNNDMTALSLEESPDIPVFLDKFLHTYSLFLIIEIKYKTMSLRGDRTVNKSEWWQLHSIQIPEKIFWGAKWLQNDPNSCVLELSRNKDMLQPFQQVIFLRMLHYLLVITTFVIHSHKKRGAVWWHFIYLA